MPGVDFQAMRSLIPMSRVLDLLGFVPHESSGEQVRGPCPVHRSTSQSSRSFSANLARNTFHCFNGGSAGNQLDLWAGVTRKPLFEVAIDLCSRLNQDLPWIRRW